MYDHFIGDILKKFSEIICKYHISDGNPWSLKDIKGNTKAVLIKVITITLMGTILDQSVTLHNGQMK